MTMFTNTDVKQYNRGIGKSKEILKDYLYVSILEEEEEYERYVKSIKDNKSYGRGLSSQWRLFERKERLLHDIIYYGNIEWDSEEECNRILERVYSIKKGYTKLISEEESKYIQNL